MEHTKKLIDYHNKSELINEAYTKICDKTNKYPDELKIIEIIDKYKNLEYKYDRISEYISDLRLTVFLLIFSIVILLAVWMFTLYI